MRLRAGRAAAGAPKGGTKHEDGRSAQQIERLK
jgi:hypothetical protein